MNQEKLLEIVQANTAALSAAHSVMATTNTMISTFFEDCKPKLDRHDEILGKDETSGLRGVANKDHTLLYGDDTHPLGLRQLVYILCVVVPAAISVGSGAGVLLYYWHIDLLAQFLRIKIGMP
jgi:hypothetical protein